MEEAGNEEEIRGIGVSWFWLTRLRTQLRSIIIIYAEECKCESTASNAKYANSLKVSEMGGVSWLNPT